jgi:competence protein ComEA
LVRYSADAAFLGMLTQGMRHLTTPRSYSMFKSLLAGLAMLFASVVAFAAVDVNKATQAELESIKGVGPAISAKILDERKKGNFKDWNDLVDRVKGVGEGNAVKLSAEGLTVGGATYKGAAAPAAAAKPAAPAAATAAKPAAPAAAAVAVPAAAAATAAKPAPATAAAPVTATKPAMDKKAATKEEPAMAAKDTKADKADKKAAAKKEKEEKAAAAKDGKDAKKADAKPEAKKDDAKK